MRTPSNTKLQYGPKCHLTVARSGSAILASIVLGVALAGCGDYSPTGGSTLPVAPVSTTPTFGEMRGTVDLTAGTIQFEPMGASAGVDAFHAQIYGNQGITVRLYNSAVVIDSVSTPGVKTLTAAVGIRNLLSHPIGDEQSGLTPTDTMGIYVFFTVEPIIGQPTSCPGCYVRITNHDGTGSFDAPAQKYFYWPERIGAFGSLTGDTSKIRRTWTFEMSGQVSTFSFNVLVSAAWPAPAETRWSVRYLGDSLPDTQSEPRWKTQLAGNGGSWAASNGVLRITTGNNSQVQFYRRDSLSPTSDAYMESSIRLNTIHPQAHLTLELRDGSKFVAIGIGRGSVGFVTWSEDFISGARYDMPTIGDFHTYQLRKYAADSAVLYVDGVQRARVNYSQLSNDPSPLAAPRIAFGSFVTRPTTSDWEYVLYELGSPRP